MDRTVYFACLAFELGTQVLAGAKVVCAKLFAAKLVAAKLVGVVLVGAASAGAGEWTQILGPYRNGRATGERLAQTWGDEGPKVEWHMGVGRGFAGVSVADGLVVLFHRLDDGEIVLALDKITGEERWRNRFPTHYVSRFSDDDGPRCIPLVHGKNVYVLGAGGGMHCLSLADGKTIWSRDTSHDFNVPDSYFGVGSTPLVEDGKLLVNIGGRDGAGLVAFATDSGRTVWRVTEEGASYSSPVVATIDGVRHVIFVTRLNCVSIDPRNGQIRFRFPFGKRGPTVNAANPLVIDRHLFLTASYQIGAKLAKIGEGEATIIWENDTSLSSQYSTGVEYQGLIYGVHGRQDGAVAQLRCVDLMTGKVVWSQRDFGMATIILADDKLIIMKTDGELLLVEPSSQGYRPLAKAKLFDGTTRALPALSDGRLYVRDTRTLKCVDLGH